PLRSSVATVPLAEALEEMWQQFGRNAATGIADLNLHGGIGAHQKHLHTAPPRRKFDGIVEEIPDHLLKPVGVAHDRPRPVAENNLYAHTLGVSGRAHNVDGALDDECGVDGAKLEAKLARRDPRQVEKVLDELRLGLGIPLDRLDRPLGLLAVEL